MSAKGKEFKVNVSTNRATAISSSAGSYPNVLYFPIDDDNVIIFNGNIYDWNASVTSPKLISSGDLNTYRGTQYLGVYYANYGNSISNKPSGVSQFALHVLLENNDSSTIQVLYSKNKIYTRAYESSSWSSWTEIGAGGITSIPQASSSALGGIKIGYSDNGRNYAVELNSSGMAYVNVPWTNTTYNVATTSANGLMSSSDKSKLDGIQAGADAVSFSRSLSSGTKIGAININGTNTDIYAPRSVEYKVATSTTLGLVRIGYPEDGKNYPVELNSSNQMYVNVPWTDRNTTYSVVTASRDGLIGKNSPLVSLAGDTKDAGNQDTIVVCGQDGSLDYSSINASEIALINKSNVWSVYQDFKAGAGNSGSDMRFKREVTCMPDVLDNLMSLNVIKYIWEHPDENGIRCTFGVKADQLLSLGGVYATMVHSRADKYDTKWVEYDRFGVLAIKALQEVVMRNKQLESRIEYLEDTINSMRRVWEENS